MGASDSSHGTWKYKNRCRLLHVNTTALESDTQVSVFTMYLEQHSPQLQPNGFNAYLEQLTKKTGAQTRILEPPVEDLVDQTCVERASSRDYSIFKSFTVPKISQAAHSPMSRWGEENPLSTYPICLYLGFSKSVTTSIWMISSGLRGMVAQTCRPWELEVYVRVYLWRHWQRTI